MKQEIKVDCVIKERRNNHYVKIEELKDSTVENVYSILQFKYLGKRSKLKNLIEKINKVGNIAEKELEEILGIKYE